MNLTTRENPLTSPARTATLNLALIIGSNREGRLAPAVADWFLEQAGARAGFTVTTVDTAQADLPTALGTPPPAVADSLATVSATLAEADAFVVLTPEYNHSYPAALKALIDWHFSEWRAKPVGFVSYGGVSGGLRAVEHLRHVFAEMHAATVRDTVSFHNVHLGFAPTEAARAAAASMLDQLEWWGRALKEAKEQRPYR
ncbi:NADPH-dependent FMN reductase [Streptomyces sp. NPDC057638]|uniref:NADPH-dependent FMN reductase n=1 Tax=Streptomyces sp. NPDC057638 TaxID=3346190 RepID=UPI0036B48468